MLWPEAAELETDRLRLEPLDPAHAAEMAAVLAPPEIYEFTGGEPPEARVLLSRYEKQVAGHSPSGDAGWLNWIIRSKSDGSAIGYVQATLTRDDDGVVGHLAWVVTPSAQGRGFAVEAARAMCVWLTEQGAFVARALIHPDHEASAGVARRLGLHPTGLVANGERVWQGASPPDASCSS